MQKEKKVKLLILTQKVDINDPILGFFHRWIEEFAKHCEQVTVIALGVGEYNLPKNVRVFSLGKELRKRSVLGEKLRKVRYILNFYHLIWRERKNYDVVFVHMNQEYVLLGGLLWEFLGKCVYMWRNHYAGSWLTDIATSFCVKVFCTSKNSYTARYKKTIFMPVGVDTERFKPEESAICKPYSILFLARMSPSKHPEILIDALAILAHTGITFKASFVGSPLLKDEVYYEKMKEKVRALSLMDNISFLSGVPNNQTPNLYRTHQIFVNTSPAGMFDKTIFEATACGCIVLTTSEDYAQIAGRDYYFDSSVSLAERLTLALTMPSPHKPPIFIEENSVSFLVKKLTSQFNSKR